MNLAITGGAGFLGYHLCNKLFNKYDNIFVLDIAPIDDREYPHNIKFVNSDVRDLERLKTIFKDIDIVIHAAAALPLWKKKDIFEVNINGTRNVLEAAKNNNIEKVIYISSTAVYGVPKKHPIYEDDPLIGVGPYGKSKIQAEEICKQYREKGVCVPIVRPKTFIGTGRLGVFQILYDWIESGKKIPIIGNGKNKYQLLEVEDLADSIGILLDASCEQANSTFNIGAEEFKTVCEDLGALFEYAKTGSRIFSVPTGIIIPLLTILDKLKLSPLYKWVYGTAGKDSFVSVEKIKRRFGWSSKCSNTQALIRSYQWYLEHKDSVGATGLTHRTVWRQGALSVFKKIF